MSGKLRKILIVGAAGSISAVLVAVAGWFVISSIGRSSSPSVDENRQIARSGPADEGLSRGEATEFLELSTSSVLQPQVPPHAESYDALKPLEARAQALDLPENGALLEPWKTPQPPSGSPTSAAADGSRKTPPDAPSDTLTNAPLNALPDAPPNATPAGIVVELDPAEAELARAFLAAAPTLRPPPMAGDPSRPGGSPIAPTRPLPSTLAPSTPSTPSTLTTPTTPGSAAPPIPGAGAGPSPVPPPTGFGVWSQEPPPAAAEASRGSRPADSSARSDPSNGATRSNATPATPGEKR